MQSVKSRLWETIRQINWFFQTNRCKEKKIGNRANKKTRKRYSPSAMSCFRY